jgi:hypothetical protein
MPWLALATARVVVLWVSSPVFYFWLLPPFLLRPKARPISPTSLNLVAPMPG